MSEKRISHVVGKGSLSHNNRCFFAKNVDTSRTSQNVEIVRIPLAKAYDDLFSKSIERYNDKQTRKCRRIDTDYFFHLFNHKVCDYTLVANNKQKSFYEDLVQVGDMHDTGCGTPDAEIAKKCLIEYAEHYIKNNPNFYVFNAVIHMDEATPHLHINYIPVGHYSKGLDTRNAMAKALEEMGYTGVNAATKWREHERAVFTEICKSHGLEIAAPQKSRGYNFTVDEYKDIQEEKKRLTEELKPLRKMEIAADESSIVGKKQLLSHNITVTPEELQQLETQKKAVAVQQIDNHNKLKGIADREKALDEREAEIAAKEAESIQLSIERSASLDRRESEIEKTNRQSVFHMNKAENQMRLATARYNEQVELNHQYSELNDKFRKLNRENAEYLHTLSEIRQAVGIPSTKGQAMLFIIGNGGEGKSRIGIVLQEIFKSAMLTGSFQRIETDKFFRYNLQNKLLMLDDDMQMSALPSTGYIKNLVTAEIPVDVEAKGQQSQQAMLYSRFLCFGNGSPKALYDKSDDFARRLIILITKPVPENRCNDPFLAEKFIAEKDKIFCWMFDGLKRLIKNNFRFTVSDKTKQNISEVMAENCNIIEFLSDKSYVTFDSDIQTSSTELYGGYFHWCAENALTALKQDTFVSWLKSNEKRYGIKYVYHVPNKNGGHVRGFKGICAKYKTILI